MLRFRILVVGRTRASFLREGERFYLERLKRYVKTEWVEVRAARATKGRSREEIMEEEGRGLLKRMQPGGITVPLDRTGISYDSEGLACWLEGLSRHAGGPIHFVIGGPLGLSREVMEQADRVLSLSKLTLTHEMVRLVLLEQLYRACTIMAGEKYHK